MVSKLLTNYLENKVMLRKYDQKFNAKQEAINILLDAEKYINNNETIMFILYSKEPKDMKAFIKLQFRKKLSQNNRVSVIIGSKDMFNMILLNIVMIVRYNHHIRNLHSIYLDRNLINIFRNRYNKENQIESAKI